MATYVLIHGAGSDGWYWHLVAPRLRPAGEREEQAPLRFAQGVGLGFAVLGTLGYALDVPALGVVATAFALAAAFLNAAFGFCLGCEMYLLIQRITPMKERALR